MNKPYETEVVTKKVTIEKLKTYLSIEETRELCKMCPEYDKRWCCPSGMPDTYELLAPYKEAVIIGVKVCYSEEVREQSRQMDTLDNMKDSLFHDVEHEVQLILLELEKGFPGSLSVSTCLLCSRCARKDGLPCRFPDRMRYNLTALGFQFTDLVKEQLGLELQWVKKGLPAFHLMVNLLLIP